MGRFRRAGRTFAAVLLLALAGCAGVAREHREVPRPGSRAPRGRLFALAISGGGSPETNYRSHLENLRSLVRVLEARGVPPERVGIFAADGSDPAPDLAVRGDAPEDLWLLPAPLRRRFRPALETRNSVLPGYRLRPARREAIRSWLREQGLRMRSGDTLLLYVTDHGERGDPGDPLDNTITLWGEKLAVPELRELLALLPPGVRVVALMSQCFGGGFAQALLPATPEPVPDGTRCGYFAAPADRYAYGCYPENRGREGVGHSFRFLSSVPLLGSLASVEEYVQTADRTPDVPHATSDAYLARIVAREAERRGRSPERAIDELLQAAFRSARRYEREIRLLDRIGQAFGLPGARSLTEVERRLEELRAFNRQLEQYAERWQQAFEALARDRFRAFADANPEWKGRLSKQWWESHTPPQRGELGRQLLAEWRRFLASDGDSLARLGSLHGRAERARGAVYRNEVREAALLRMRTVLIRIAGLHLLRTAEGLELEAAGLEALADCEGLRLADPPAAAGAASLPVEDPFPPLPREKELLASVRPAWLGIRYRPVPDGVRARMGLPRGAAVVTEVFGDSAAERAGLRVEDVILGPPGRPFAEPHGLREWVMRQEAGSTTEVQVIRAGELLELSLRPDPFPIELPDIPGPPEVGSRAPELHVRFVRGEADLRPGEPRVLFFWATWCLICKAAIPELSAFARHHGARVIAITDEDPQTVRSFLRDAPSAFPGAVAVDPYRITFQRFAVSGVPTFVWVDGGGTVRHVQTGYDVDAGLRIPGWRWEGGDKG